MQKYGPGNLRNIALISHSGAGKTSLAEVLLFTSGAITRMGKAVEGNTVSDYEPEEVKRRSSIQDSLIPVEWGGVRLNIIDTPGYADFVGEVMAALHVADAALMLVDAASGVEMGTELYWKYASHLPRIILVNKMERENADFYRTLQQLQKYFGPRCLPLQLSIGSQSAFSGVVDLVKRKAFSPEEGGIPPSLAGEVSSHREKLVEAAAEADDALVAKYLEGVELSEKEVLLGLKKAVLSRSAFPVLAGSALLNRGIPQLLDALVSLVPSPKEAPPVIARKPGGGEVELRANEGGPLAALVFKTSADPYVGKLSYLRVYSGTLSSDSSAYNASKGKDERIGQLYHLRGKEQLPVPALGAGDIGVIAKLGDTSTGNTLSSREQPLTLSAPPAPIPVYSSALYPKSKADLDKMSTSLARLVEEDPALSLRRDPDTGEMILSGQGETAIAVAAEKLKRKFGVEVLAEVPKVPYKETITITTQVEYRHKKQTGGHGQYGHVFLELVPLPRGSGFEFTGRLVGGSVPKEYIPAVEKGVRKALVEGYLAGYPIVDMRVTLYDGTYHSVDSSNMAFEIAGGHALRKGVGQGKPVLLEPIMRLKVVAPKAFAGDIAGDLNGKRARVYGMTPEDGDTVIEAEVPLAEVQRYATTIRSITQGRGSFTLEFSHYEEVPAQVTQKIIASAPAKKGD